MRTPALLLLLAVILAPAPGTATVDPGSDPEARRTLARIYDGAAGIDHAEQLLTDRCMQRLGFDHGVVPPMGGHGLPTGYSDDVARARQSGFGLRAERERAVLAGEPTATASAAHLSALHGPPGGPMVRVRTLDGSDIDGSTTGCRASALRELYGSIRVAISATELRVNLVPAIAHRARATSPSVQTAFASWRDCMQRAGHPSFLDRNGAEGAARIAYDRLPVDLAESAETASAVDDATCDREADYSAVAQRAEDRGYAEFLTEHGDEFDELLRAHLSAVRRAGRILASAASR